jgi:hypothetical protein
VVSFLLTFPLISCMHSSSPQSCYMPCPSHSPWLDHSNYTWRRVHVRSQTAFLKMPYTSMRLEIFRVLQLRNVVFLVMTQYAYNLYVVTSVTEEHVASIFKVSSKPTICTYASQHTKYYVIDSCAI